MKFFDIKINYLTWCVLPIMISLIVLFVVKLFNTKEGMDIRATQNGMEVRAGGIIDPNYESYFVRPLCVNKPDSEVYRYGAPGTDRDPKKRHNIFKVTYPTRPSVTGMFDTTGPLGYNSVECDQNSICNSANKHNKTPNKKISINSNTTKNKIHD